MKLSLDDKAKFADVLDKALAKGNATGAGLVDALAEAGVVSVEGAESEIEAEVEAEPESPLPGGPDMLDLQPPDRGSPMADKRKEAVGIAIEFMGKGRGGGKGKAKDAAKPEAEKPPKRKAPAPTW
jgi:hypothetical protein